MSPNLPKFPEYVEKVEYKADQDVIWVGEFNEEKALKFNEAVLKLSRDNPQRPIVLHIDSYGGSCYSLMSMLGTIDSIPNPIITVCVGKAMSCGAILLAHGDYRFAAEHSMVMIHEVSGCAWGKVLDIKNDEAQINRLNEQLLGMLAKDCGIKGGVKALRKKFLTNEHRELYLNPEESLKFGIVDHIGLPSLNKVTRFDLDIK